MCSSASYAAFSRVSWGYRPRRWLTHRSPSWLSGSGPRWSGGPIWACLPGGARSYAGRWSSPAKGSRSYWSGTWSPRSSGGSPPRTPGSPRHSGRDPSHMLRGPTALSMNVSLPWGNRRYLISKSAFSLKNPLGKTGPKTLTAYTRKHPSIKSLEIINIQVKDRYCDRICRLGGIKSPNRPHIWYGGSHLWTFLIL